jgi:hypothetical protein
MVTERMGHQRRITSMLSSSDLQYALAQAEKNFSAAQRTARQAEAVVYSTNPWKIAYGRALSALDVARSNVEGCFAKIQLLRGDLDEALNMELHGYY